ncbi:MAG TPA: hypothetical protein VF992_04570 [Thermoplasmata archaeon]
MDIGLTSRVWKLDNQVASLEAAVDELRKRLDALEAAMNPVEREK